MVNIKGINIDKILFIFLCERNLVTGNSRLAIRIENKIGTMISFPKYSAAPRILKESRLRDTF
jgi:hypothetical protein